MKTEKYEVIIPTNDELNDFLNKFEVPNKKNFILHSLRNMSKRNIQCLLRKKEYETVYSVLILNVTLKTIKSLIKDQEHLLINKEKDNISDFYTFDYMDNMKEHIIHYEDDVKLYNDNNFEIWYDELMKTNIPKVECIMGLNLESTYCYLFGYEKLFSIPGQYKCKSITIPYDDIVDLSYLSQEAFSNLVDLVKEKTIREVIKVKEGLTLTPLNIPNLNTINLIPTDRKYTKNDLKYLNQRKIKELCYYLKLGYDANEIYDTGLYGKNLIYNNTRKLLKMGVFTRDEINIKFPENNTVFVETFYKDLMYRKWRGMLDRCYNEENISYPNYGGRGITVCNEWKDPDFGFENYYRDITENIGHWPGNGYSIDRIRNNGNYTLGNVRWATVEEQNNNRSFKRNKK